MIGWTYVCVGINAKEVASVPIRLYTTKPRAARDFAMAPVPPDRLEFLRTNEAVAPSVRSQVERATFDGQSVEEITDIRHPWNKIHREPNPYLHWFDTLELTVMYRQLLGSAHWYRTDDGTGVPDGLWPLPSHALEQVAREKQPEAGWLWRGSVFDMVFPEEASQGISASQVGGNDRTDRFLPESDVIHFRRVNPKHPYGKGLSAVRAGLLPIDTSVLMQEYRKAVIENDGTPTFALFTDKKLQEKMVGEILDGYARQREEVGAGMPAVFHGGLKPETLGLSPRELDFRSGADQVRDEIAAIFEVPVAYLKTENVNKANDLAAQRRHRSMTVRPMCSRIESELNTRLIWPFFGDDFFLAFDNPVPEDVMETAERHQKYFFSGAMTPNEIRAEIPLPASDDPAADLLYAQGATAPISKLAEPDPEPAEIEDVDGFNAPQEGAGDTKPELVEAAAACDCGDHRHSRAHGVKSDFIVSAPQALIFAIRQVFMRQRDAVLDNFHEVYKVLRYTSKSYQRASKNFPFSDEWAAEFDDATRALISAEIQKGARKGLAKIRAALGDDSGAVGFDITRPEAVEFLETYAAELSTNPVRGWPAINDRTGQQVSRAISEGITAGENMAQVAARVAKVMDTAVNFRSVRIARTETARAQGAGTELSYIASGQVESKEWLQGPGPCPSGVCEIDGQTRDLGESFSNGVEFPPAHPSCSCSIAPVVQGVEDEEA